MGDDRREDNLTFHFNSQILTLASGQTNLKLKFKIIQPHFFFSYLAEREETLMEALGYMHNCFRFFFWPPVLCQELLSAMGVQGWETVLVLRSWQNLSYATETDRIQQRSAQMSGEAGDGLYKQLEFSFLYFRVIFLFVLLALLIYQT